MIEYSQLLIVIIVDNVILTTYIYFSINLYISSILSIQGICIIEKKTRQVLINMQQRIDALDARLERHLWHCEHKNNLKIVII